MNTIRRRLLLAGVAIPTLSTLQGCRASLPRLNAAESTPAAKALLAESAAAHGAPSLLDLHDINVSYHGEWHWLVTKLQPALVDSGFRGGSEERMLLKEQLLGQAHRGPKGHKQVVRLGAAAGQGDVRVWLNDAESHDDDSRHAAALVADGYSLFLLGPLWVDAQRAAGRRMIMTVAGSDTVVDRQLTYSCDVLRLSMRPGLGLSEEDQLALYIDRNTGLMRRVRLTLEGLESTRGALVEVDTFDPKTVFGLTWPTRFSERLLRPAPLKVHEWRLTGLDVNRGYGQTDIMGDRFAGAAESPASILAT